jgi:lysophospholipase L1-like esterase
MRTLLLLALAVPLWAQGQRILIIGDSISIGYTPFVTKALTGKATVVHNEGNAAHTGNGVAKLEQWLGDGQWDLIHFNFGLHDLKIMDGGQHQVPLDEYERNLKTIVKRLKQTKAKLIWASTTPVPPGKVNPLRHSADVPKYNAIATRIMKAEKIPVNDLFSADHSGQLPANVHYTPAGYEALANQVLKAISQ